jgi:esterase/lipase superfamily enzyme
MSREVAELWSDPIGAAGTVIRYGHWGRAVLVFPTERGMAAYFNNPMDYVGHLEGDHLDWLRSRANLLLACGQGQWEDTTGSLLSSKQFAGLLAGKGIRHELDVWGHDVPHDWPSWRAQVAHHMPRFC